MMKRAVILDRDGVINEHRHFVNHPNDLYLYGDAASAIRALNEQGLPVYVATNQGGVGLGYLSEATLTDIHAKMLDELREQGAHIDDIVYCAHKPEENCDCRKPKPGMLLELKRRHGLDMRYCYMVGDRETDVEAGKRAGTLTIRIGKGKTEADHQAQNLSAA